MKYVLVTGYNNDEQIYFPQTHYHDLDETAKMEILSEDGTTVVCQNPKNNYPENVYRNSGALTDGSIVSCGSYDGKFFLS